MTLAQSLLESGDSVHARLNDAKAQLVCRAEGPVIPDEVPSFHRY